MASQDGAEHGSGGDAVANGRAEGSPGPGKVGADSAAEQKRADDFRSLQTRALELAAENRPLRGALNDLMLAVEARSS